MLYNISAEERNGWRAARQHYQRRAKRWVVKVGTSSLLRDDASLDQEKIEHLLMQVVAMQGEGMEVVVVLSGAVGVGANRLCQAVSTLTERERKVAASIGQSRIVHALLEASARLRSTVQEPVEISQVLFSRDDFSYRKRYRNACVLLRDLLRAETVPVINENDVIGGRAHSLGNNDRVAALIASMVDADLLVLLTDQQGLYTSNPKENKHARLITEGIAEDPQLLQMAKGEGEFGTGGMQTKLLAARMAAQCGIHTVIAASSVPNVLLRLSTGEAVGTFLYQQRNVNRSRVHRRMALFARTWFRHASARDVPLGAR
ncbi:glutamate 5-kinase [Acidithiobacillus sp. IBUN Pt1247-S3]|uniref:glutamate 5-kinase n=1 Tax=Acidithiobacillus sp. IBUN Pt1247-S3 TaxID=3166642 RepID=UPI0034E5044C